ncbi:hypothetical protein GBO34_00850 [Roseivirga pacifica]|uniref:hypothetical protein n=1 Tax=Roseivirga pacifica TaxID=1267423 RepID=UPI002095CC45|nr:hypothetical protein [Roseivirga pacifica]MCO6367861.1 hypothetical protein [Roseivirga pacifica]MCO6377233.1 hypothetical protein [Roseivirga pacifica]
MKTQISNLRSGTKNQILNPEIDYSQFPQATSHVGHSGSNHADVESIWSRVINENPESMKVIVKGIELELTANWSLSRKSVSYCGGISKQDLEGKFYLKASKKETPSISIQNGNIIVVSNGKNSYSHICPSLIEIV